MTRKTKARLHYLDVRRSAHSLAGICGHIGLATKKIEEVTCRVCLKTLKQTAEKLEADRLKNRDKRGDGAPPAVLLGPGQSVVGSDGERAIARSIAGEEPDTARWSSFQAAWCAYVKISDERRSVASSSSPDRFGHRDRGPGRVPTTPRESQPDFLDFERARDLSCTAQTVGEVELSAGQVRSIAELRVCGKPVVRKVRGMSGVTIPGRKGTYVERIEADVEEVAEAFGLTRHQVGLVVRRVSARGNEELARMGLVRRRPVRQNEQAGEETEASMDCDGWKEISAAVGRSEDTCQRLAAREEDPLPVRRFGGRIVAKRADLEAWKSRQVVAYAS